MTWAFGVFEIRADDAPPLSELLENIRAKHGLPALAAAAMQKTTLLGSGAVGVRKIGSNVPVTIDDQWQIGSCTKSMTATLAAMLVERGQIRWDTTVGAAFPELSDTMEPQWAAVTLEQLLLHRGGAPAEAPPNLWKTAFARYGREPEQRMRFVTGLLLRRPEAAPGAQFIYSNQGYAVAGTMLERAAGQPWEKLMQAQIFPVALLHSAGFGAPASPGKTDQPWGHEWKDGRWWPVASGRRGDNPPAIAPAAAVHCSIAELVRYAAWHALGDRRGTGTLKKESFTKLHTPWPGADYAMGWVVASRAWAGGNALTHAGSNTNFYVVIWIAPQRDAALVAATNCAGEAAQSACDEAVAAMIARFLSAPEK